MGGVGCRLVKVTVDCGWGGVQAGKGHCGWGGVQAGKGHCRLWVGWGAGW